MKLTVLTRLFLLFIAFDSFGQVMPIAQARKLRPGTVVAVTGRVTVSREFGDLTFIQDATGGIPVYNADVAASLARGDSVVVFGKLAKFNGLLEILPDSARRTGTIGRVILPKDLEPSKLSDHEAELVRITGVLLKPSGHFFYPQRQGLILKESDSLNYWIDGDTDLPGHSIPSDTVTITAVVGRYRDQMQLLPRSSEDIPGLNREQASNNAHHLSIMNWNIEFFGATREKYGSEFGPADEGKQVANVASLLNAVQPDVVALQEVSDDAAFGDLLKVTPGYEGRCSSRFSYSHDTSEDFPPQKVCFIYKTRVARVVHEKILFRKLYDDALASQSKLLDDAPGGAASVFSSGRLPYLLELDVKVGDVMQRISLVNLHGKSGASADDHARRLFDAKILKDTLDRYYSGRKLIVLGDFNDDMDISIAGRRASPYSSFVTDPTYACITKSLSDNDWHSTISYDDVIDHQVVSASMGDNYVAGSVQVVNPFGLIEDYAATTSDHLPVMSEFDLRQIVTGIDDIKEVSIFPNPTTGGTDIICKGYFEFRLISLSGKVVMSGSGFGHTLLDAPPGVHLLTIIGQSTTRAFRLVRH